MQLPNFFHIGAVRGIHLTHMCANPGTIEMPAAIHTWARWALGQKFRPDLIGFIVAQGQPTIECRDSLYVAPCWTAGSRLPEPAACDHLPGWSRSFTRPSASAWRPITWPSV